MSGVEVVLVVGAFAFAAVTGANNGGTLVAVQLRATTAPPWLVALVLAAAVGLGPVLVGTAVADTVASKLTVFVGPSRGFALGITLAFSVAVVGTLSRRGLPTSLFAALIGAITGAGLGLGLHIQWGNVASVFAAAVFAPWIGAGVAWAIRRVQPLRPPRRRARDASIGRHAVPYLLLCLAYGMNGAQVMVALLSLALERSPASVAGDAGLLVGLAACFALGTVVGLSRLSASVGAGIVTLRPSQSATAQVASTLAVGGAALVGLPVSTTQVVTASLVGCGAAESYRRIRWQHAKRIGVAWLLTLPVTLALVAVAGLIGRAWF